MKNHPVFHVVKLRPFEADPIPERRPVPPPPPVVVGNGPDKVEYEVESIDDSRLFRKKHLQYLVRWKGYRREDRQWEPAANVKNAPLLIEKFHQENPNAPRHISALDWENLNFRPIENFTEVDLEGLVPWEMGRGSVNEDVDP
jgi:hypothetical protein